MHYSLFWQTPFHHSDFFLLFQQDIKSETEEKVRVQTDKVKTD